MSTTLTLIPTQGRQRAKLYKLGVVKAETSADNGNALIQLHMPREDLLRLIAEEHLDPAAFDPTPYPILAATDANSGLSQVDEAG